MRTEGMTVRDIGAALGISHQRAQQLVSSQPAAFALRDVPDSAPENNGHTGKSRG
jgi:hypothetical protein